MLALLAGLVLLLHGMALQGLQVTWPTTGPAMRAWQVQLPARASTLPMPSIASESGTSQASKGRSTPSLQAAQPAAPSDMAASTSSLTADPPASKEAAIPDTAPTPLSDALANPAPAPVAAEATPPAAPPSPSTPSPPPSPAAVPPRVYRWPASAKWVFDFVGESKGIRFSADGDMVWKHDGQQYQLRQEVRHLLLGARSQSSSGRLNELGLQPERFGDKFKQEVAAHFERSKGIVSFSANTPSQTLQDGAQDRLSLFVQLASLMQGNPDMRQLGQQIQLQVVSARSAEVWAFAVAKQETLALPIGSLPALKVSRLPLQQYDQTIDMWLSPAHGYMPVRVRIAQSNGDVLEQFLRKVETP